ncbi:hypothetical protein ACIPX0_42905 [Streptomyces sp. NPDC090075]|uniref:hypothetical protein n=1 Tax=Streptomyces sp. NPDC090075 TaxID=3365937 RepID=UPI003803B9A6
MPESGNYRNVRKPLLFVVAGAVVVAGLLAAYLAGAFDRRGEIRADDVCSNLDDREKAATKFSSVLPDATKYDFSTGMSGQPGWHYNINCFAKGDGKTLLVLNANAVSTVSWQKWVEHELPPTKGKVTYFSSGLKGISATNIAAIYVPCYASEQNSQLPYSLTVYAQAPKGLRGSEEKERQTLIDLATTFGRYAHKDAKCDLPSKLPN